MHYQRVFSFADSGSRTLLPEIPGPSRIFSLYVQEHGIFASVQGLTTNAGNVSATTKCPDRGPQPLAEQKPCDLFLPQSINY